MDLVCACAEQLHRFGKKHGVLDQMGVGGCAYLIHPQADLVTTMYESGARYCHVVDQNNFKTSQ